jgi:hypothetical protein
MVMRAVITVLLVLPLIAVGLLLLVRRSTVLRPLVPALVLSGIPTAFTTAFFAFLNASVPIAPYELGRGAWWPVIRGVLLALYVGFGIGVVIAALIGLPYQWLIQRRRGP